MSELVGQTLGRYKIISLLGEGGMGAVFKGEDPTLRRVVAVKVMHPHLARQAGFADRFLQEARVTAQLDYPGIVKVYEFNQAGDLLFIVMEFIPGDNLRQLLHDLRSSSKWLSLQEAVEITRQVALALDYAHRQGVLHRDIKPDNVMLKAEPIETLPFRPVITDLGLAKLREGGVQTDHGMSLGTPAYMSPEQALGQAVDARSDVYSLGILLYELAVGRLPFAVTTISEAISAHTQQAPPPPRTLRPDLPAGLEQIILRALAKDPATRYPSAAAMAQALAAASADATQVASAPPTLVAGSLATQYQTSLAKPRGHSAMAGLPTPPPAGQDRIVIRAPEGGQRMVAIESRDLIVGRSSTAAIVLEDTKVSRQHAKISFDGKTYQVTDLDSTNGTLLANAKLLPGIPQEWTPDKPLRIGDHWLHLQRGAQAAKTTLVHTDGTVVDVTQQHTSANKELAAFLEPSRLAVEAGGSVVATLGVLNQGTYVDHFAVTVAGVPAAWLPATLPPIQLMPGEQKMVSFALQPPRVAQSRAGDYPLTVQVTNERDPTQLVELQATLAVAAYRQIQSQLKPARLQAGASGQVVVENQGNGDETYAIAWSDRGDELVFKPAQTQLTVPAGQVGTASFMAKPAKHRWIGGQKSHPFTAQVTPPQGPPQTPQGELVSSGRLPPWLPPALIFLCLGLAVIASQIPKLMRTSPTATPIPAPAKPAMPPQPPAVISTPTADLNATAAAETATAAEYAQRAAGATTAVRRTAVAAAQTEDARRVVIAAPETEDARQVATATEAARQAAIHASETQQAAPRRVDFGGGSRVLQLIPISEWPSVTNEYGNVGPDSAWSYMLEATGNTWMGLGGFEPITPLDGDFIMDITFEVVEKEDCSLDISLSDYDTDYSSADFYLDIWQTSPPTFSIYENWIVNRFNQSTVTLFSDRSPIPYDSSAVNWSNENILSIKREGSEMTFYLNGHPLQSFQPSMFVVKQMSTSVAFKCRIRLTKILTKVPA